MTETINSSKSDAMGKEALRAACREAGISYGKLTNDGMRAALVAHYATNDEDLEEDDAVHPRLDAFTSLINPQAVLSNVQVQSKSNTIVRDGKRVETSVLKRREHAEKITNPRVYSRGYTIQKNREERNGVRRPSEGTVCGKVWAEFDKQPQIKASDLSALADENGWNLTNVSCEFYTWRRFMGIRGRSVK